MSIPQDDDPRLSELDDIIARATQRRAEATEAFLRDVCAGDAELLRHARTRLGESHTTAMEPDGQLVLPEPIARELGGYSLLRRIGEGGMGVVYEAEQKSPRRRVALKVLRGNLASGSVLKRFRDEAAVLARMTHPWIARVIEAHTQPTEEGEPLFIAMEFVDGLPLTEYVEHNHLGVRDRLELVARIADAVQHAHEQGIVHRDLKPTNILVERKGTPKVLDFGVAHVADTTGIGTSLATEPGQMLGTFAYMSPEQVRARSGDIDPRTDVYTLGVILYELLSGQLPFPVDRLDLVEAARVIQHEEPLALGRVARTFRGDVEAIVQKCLQKERKKRYECAGALRDDLRRHLDHESIHARKVSHFDALGKALRRHRGVAFALASTAAALLLGATFALIFALQAIEAREEARAEADRTRSAERIARERLAVSSAVNAFLNEDLLGGLDPREARGHEVTVREVVERAAAKVDEIENDAVRAEVHRTLASTSYQLGDYARARRHYESALAIANPGDLHTDLDWLSVRRQLASTLIHLDDTAEARQLLMEGLERARGDDRMSRLEHAAHLVALGNAAGRSGDFRTARASFLEALTTQEELLGRTAPNTLTTLEHLADLEVRSGNYAAARPLTEEILATRRANQGDDHPTSIRTLANTARLTLQAHDVERAAALIDEYRSLVERVFGKEHDLFAHALDLSAQLALERGRLEEGVELTNQRIALLRRVSGERSSDVARALQALGRLRHYGGRYPEAEALFRESIEILERLAPVEADLLVAVRRQLASTINRLGRNDEAETLLRETLAVSDRIFPVPSVHGAVARNDLALCLLSRREYAEAESLLRASLEMTTQLLGENSSDAASTSENLANVLGRLGKDDEAKVFLERTLSIRRKLLDANDPAIGRTLFNMGFTAMTHDDFAGARPLLEEALAITRASLGTEHPDHAHMEDGLAWALIELGEGTSALPLLDHALAVRRARFPAGHANILATLERRGRLLLSLDRPEDAVTDLTEAVAIRERTKKDQPVPLARVRLDRARALHAASRTAHALLALHAARDTFAADEELGNEAREFLTDLATVYRELGHEEDARRVEERTR